MLEVLPDITVQANGSSELLHLTFRIKSRIVMHQWFGGLIVFFSGISAEKSPSESETPIHCFHLSV